MAIAAQNIVYSLPGLTQKLIQKGSEIVIVDAEGNELDAEAQLKAFGEYGLSIIASVRESVQAGEEPGEDEEPTEPEVQGVTFTPVNGNVLTEVQLQENETFVYTQDVQGSGFEALELDIIIKSPQGGLKSKEQFTVYASTEDATGGQEDFQAQGVSVQFVETEQGGKWVVDFGSLISQALAASGEVVIVAQIRDAEKNFIWGDMYNTSPEMKTKVNVSYI